MAKNDGLKLSELNESLRSGKMGMNPDVAAQINKALQENVDVIKKETTSESSLNKNINKLTKAIEKNTAAMVDFAKKLAFPKVKSDLSESDIEQGVINNRVIKLLEIIAENTTPKEEVKAKEKDEGFALGKWAMIIAGLLGATAGLLKSWYIGVKAILGSIFSAFKSLSKFLFNLLPESMKAGIKSNIAKISTFFSDMVTKLGIAFEFGLNIVKDFFKNKILTGLLTAKNAIMTSMQPVIKAFTAFSEMFTGAGRFAAASTKIVDGITSFFSAIQKFGARVMAGVKAIGNIGFVAEQITAISKWFSGIVGWVTSFGGFIGKTASFFSKLALPLNIIMGLYGGITKSFDKFAKGDIIGGIVEFSSGALELVVGGFLDAVKSIVSWVLGAIGLDSVEKWLDSFSFTGIIEGFFDYVEKFYKALAHPIDTIVSAFDWVTEKISGLFEGFELPDMIKDLAETLFKPFETFKNLFTGLFDWFTDFEIPGIGFSVFGKKFQFGPWHPFKSDEKEAENKVEGGGDEKSESVSGTLKGVTGEQVKSHPNYKKYYDESMKDFNDPVSSREEATMRVKEDMVKEQKSKPKGVLRLAGMPMDYTQYPTSDGMGHLTTATPGGEVKPKPEPAKPADIKSDKSVLSSALDWFTGKDKEDSTKGHNGVLRLPGMPMDYTQYPKTDSMGHLTKANKIYGDSAMVSAADKQVPLTKSTNVVNAPTQVNNQTQNASFKAPVRNQDNTLMGYLKNRFA